MISQYYEASTAGAECGAVTTDPDVERRIAVSEPIGTDLAMTVMDVTDPTKPEVLSELILPWVSTYDVTLTPDGRYAAIGANAKVPSNPLLPQILDVPFAKIGYCDAGIWQVETVEDNTPYATSTILVDLADPERPVVADWVPMAAVNVHSVELTESAGATWLVTSVVNLVHAVTYWEFFQVVEVGGVGKIVPYGTYLSADLGCTARLECSPVSPLTNGHIDGMVMEHPSTGQTLGFLANWDGGLVIVDILGPGAIVPLSTFYHQDMGNGDGMMGQVHNALPMQEMRNGRHITLIGQEIYNVCCRSTGEIVMVDTTDPSNPFAVARWTVPVEFSSNSYSESLHYPVLQNDTMYVSAYHLGVWAVNASEEHWPNLPAMGVFMPDNPAPSLVGTGVYPNVMEVAVLPDGRVVIWDGPTGIYVTTFDENDYSLPWAEPFSADLWIE